MGEEIVCFHSVLGLSSSVLWWGAHIRAAGHTVHMPDLFDGEVFRDVPAGLAKRDALGIPRLIQRAQDAVRDLPPSIVCIGFSMGAGLAEIIAATRPHTRGAVLMHGAFPLADLQLSRWPSATPAQVHISASDPFVSSDAADAFANDVRAAGANADVFVYDAAGHLFAESGTFDYDADAAAMMRARVLEFLAQL